MEVKKIPKNIMIKTQISVCDTTDGEMLKDRNCGLTYLSLLSLNAVFSSMNVVKPTGSLLAKFLFSSMDLHTFRNTFGLTPTPQPPSYTNTHSPLWRPL